MFYGIDCMILFAAWLIAIRVSHFVNEFLIWKTKKKKDG